MDKVKFKSASLPLVKVLVNELKAIKLTSRFKRAMRMNLQRNALFYFLISLRKYYEWFIFSGRH